MIFYFIFPTVSLLSLLFSWISGSSHNEKLGHLLQIHSAIAYIVPSAWDTLVVGLKCLYTWIYILRSHPAPLPHPDSKQCNNSHCGLLTLCPDLNYLEQLACYMVIVSVHVGRLNVNSLRAHIWTSLYLYPKYLRECLNFSSYSINGEKNISSTT